jgi:formylglycine-generating enzyme required for sulfatase activity/energy-coupling factor transporter ATP-binding protein EcfA2
VALIRYVAPDSTPSVGSGLLVDERVVLTADHVAEGSGHLVEFGGGTREVVTVLRSGTPDVDLALLSLRDPVEIIGRMAFARVDRSRVDRVSECVAVGFPRWKKDGNQRRSAQVDGLVPTAEGLESTADSGLQIGLLTLVGNRIPGAPEIPVGTLTDKTMNPWGGMSGAGVVASDMVIGVVRSHNLAAGGQSLTITPLTALDRLPSELRQQFWDSLGVPDPGLLPALPAAIARPGPVAGSGFRDQLARHAEGMLRDERYRQWTVAGPDGPVARAVQPRAMLYRGSSAAPEPLLQVLARSALPMRVVLLGEPGGGKTTALELFSCDLLRGSKNAIASQARPLPILINVHNYAGESSLLPLIRDALRQYGVLKLSEAETELLLDHYNCAILLDGLNEVGSGSRSAIGRALNRLATGHPEASIVASCRITDFGDFESDLTGFEILKLAEWRPDQIAQFLAMFADGSAYVSVSELDRLDDPSILSNPFLLSLVTRLGRRIDLHMQRVDVLREYVRGERVVGKVSTHSGVRQKLLPTARRVAYAIQQNRQRKLSIDNIFAEIEAERGARGYNSEEMFSALHQAGLLTSDLQDGWFRYEYLEEFFSAELMADRLNQEEVVRLAADIGWRQTISLYFSMAELSAAELEGFLGPDVDRWIRYRAATLLGERGDPRLDSMVRVPGGHFILGRDDGPTDEGPAHCITLGTFEIDKFPVTNIQYARFLANSGRESPPHWTASGFPSGTANQPVTNVSWEDALAYADWANKRLPTEAEWEKAASWADDERKFRWPWGDQFDPARLNSDTSSRFWIGDTTPVGIYAHGASRYGALDMCGNVWEWTSSVFKPYPYDPYDGREENGDTGRRVLRGGSWRSTSPEFLTVTKRDAFTPSASWGGNVGFRCVGDAISGG